jgi:hypothetical protein
VDTLTARQPTRIFNPDVQGAPDEVTSTTQFVTEKRSVALAAESVTRRSVPHPSTVAETPLVCLLPSAPVEATATALGVNLQLRSGADKWAVVFEQLSETVLDVQRLFRREQETGALRLLGQLKTGTQLPASNLADLLMVSRRTLYNWLAGEKVSPTNFERIVDVKTCLEPLMRRWRPTQLRVWLESGDPSPLELARRRDWDEFLESVTDASRGTELTLRQTTLLDPSEASTATEVRPLTPSLRRSAISSFLESRQPRPTPRGRLPELSDYLAEDE